ncbi:MAG TPA: hypothetical protein VGH74_09435 [Planctomycetaceae bacterium]|jgi:hypothetical protein
MSLLNSMMTWFNAAAGGNLAVSVIYQRGATQVPWSATPAETEFESSEEADATDTFTSRDYVGDTATLVNGGITMPPLDGDKVIEVISGKTVTHELMMIHNGQPFRFDDAGEQRVCVHTKEVSRV